MKITSCNIRREDILGYKQQMKLVLLDQKQKYSQYQQAQRARSCRISTDPSIQTDLPRVKDKNNNQLQDVNCFKRINTLVISCHQHQPQISTNDSRIKLSFNQDNRNNNNNNNLVENTHIHLCSTITQPTQQDSLVINKQHDALDQLQVSLSEITGWDNNSEENTTASQMELDNLQEYYQRTYSQRNIKQCLPVAVSARIKENNQINTNAIDSPNDLHANSTPRKRDIKSSKNPSNSIANNSHPISNPARKLVATTILRQRMQASSLSSPSVLNSLILPSQLGNTCTRGGLQFNEEHILKPPSQLQVSKIIQHSSIPLSAKPQPLSQSSPFFSSLLLSNDRLLDNRKKSLAQFHIVRNIPPEEHPEISSSNNTLNKVIRMINDKKVGIDEDSDKNQQSLMHNDSMIDGEHTTNKQMLTTNQGQEMIVRSPKKLIKHLPGVIVEVVSSCRDQETHSPKKCIQEINRKYIITSKDNTDQKPHKTTSQPKIQNHNRQANSTTATTSKGQSSLRFYDRNAPENPTTRINPSLQDKYQNILSLPLSSPSQPQSVQSISPALIHSVSSCPPQLPLYGFPVVVLPTSHLSSLLLPPNQELSQLSQIIDLQPTNGDNIISTTAEKDNYSKNSVNDPLSSRLKGVSWCSPSNKLANRQQKSMEYLQRQFENKSQRKHNQTNQQQMIVVDSKNEINHQVEGDFIPIQLSQEEEYLHAKQDFPDSRGGIVNIITNPADTKQLMCKGQEFSDGQFGAFKDSLVDKRKEASNANYDSRFSHKLIFYPEKLQQQPKYLEHQQYSRQHSQHVPQLNYELHTNRSVHSEYYPTSLSQSSFPKLSENNSRNLSIHNDQQQQQQQSCIITRNCKNINQHSSQSPRNVETTNSENSDSVSFQEQIRKIMETQRHQQQIKVLERQFQNTKQGGGSGGGALSYPKPQAQCALSSQGFIRKAKQVENNNQQQLV